MEKQDKIKKIILKAINTYPSHYWKAYREAKKLFYNEIGWCSDDRDWMSFIDKLQNCLDEMILENEDNENENNYNGELINICEKDYLKNYLNSKFKGVANA